MMSVYQHAYFVQVLSKVQMKNPEIFCKSLK